MTHSDGMVREFLAESTNTRRLLERLPEDKLSWKPHEKSMSLSRLATHIAEIPTWADTIVNQDFFDMAASEFKPVGLNSRTEILDTLQKNVDLFTNLLKGKSDEVLFETWKLKEGEKVLLEMPRMAVLRFFVLSHVIHHRGQLTVYLRQNSVPLPGIYGPSADEKG